MPLPTHEERAGERTFREIPDSKSDDDQYLDEAINNAPDTADATANIASIVQAGVNPVRPTGQHVEAPRGGEYVTRDQPESGVGDLATGFVAVAAVVAHAKRQLRKRAERKRGDDGNE
jgi:hypothetical protein